MKGRRNKNKLAVLPSLVRLPRYQIRIQLHGWIMDQSFLEKNNCDRGLYGVEPLGDSSTSSKTSD